jgi:Mn2+/Fe2+ NRAMP family transporter
MLTAAVTLNAHGITDIRSSALAAQALQPIAGDLAFTLFSIGIIGTGLLAIPVLAGASAYAMAGAFGWNSSLESTPIQAKPYYVTIAVSTLFGMALGLTTVDLIRALYWSAVINGVISVPIMVVMLLMAAAVAVAAMLLTL